MIDRVWGKVVPFKIDGESLVEEVTFEERLEGGDGVSLTDICRKRVPRRGNSMCKGPGQLQLFIQKSFVVIE